MMQKLVQDHIFGIFVLQYNKIIDFSSNFRYVIKSLKLQQFTKINNYQSRLKNNTLTSTYFIQHSV